MLFDLVLVTPSELRLTIISFSAAFSLLALWYFFKLTPNATSAVHYGGIPLLLVVVTAAVWQLPTLHLRLGLLASAGVLLLAGRRDERVAQPASWQLVWQLAICLLVVSAGWTIPHVSNLFGGGVVTLTAFGLGGMLAVIWLLFLMNAVNWLDGVDGLASSVSLVAFIVLALISILPATQDQLTLRLSLIGVGALAAFLVWNWFPARLRLGTVGSWLLGFYLGLVAIVGGGKIATTALVLAVPLLDFIAVSLQRILQGQAPWQGDSWRHAHYRLRSLGFSPAYICLVAIAVSAAAGWAAVALQTRQKLGILATLLVLVVVLLVATTRSKVKP